MSIKAVRGERSPSSNDHVLRMALRVLKLPWFLLRSAYRGVCRLVGACKSEGELRDDDQRRQSRARRTLRGLTPDHDTTITSPPEVASGKPQRPAGG